MSGVLRSYISGKLPIHGDFVRVKMPGEEGATVDRWVEEGLQRAREELGRKFDATFMDSAPFRFLYFDLGSRSGVVGTCRPSRDAHGRHYPVVVGYTLSPSSEWGPDQWPLALAAPLAAAESLLDEGVEDLESLHEGLAALEGPPDPGAAARAWQGGLATRRAADLWQGMPGGQAAGRAVLSALRQLLGESYPPRFLLRLPAGQDADATLWLALVSLWSPPGTLPVFAAWPAAGLRGAGPNGCRIVLDDLKAVYLPGILWPGRPSPVAHDLAVGADRLPPSPGHAGPAATGATLLDILRELRHSHRAAP